MATKFSALLKSYRLRAQYGLRQFAELIGDAPSNYANRESGKRNPWRDSDKLRSVAQVLGLREGSQDWDAFFFAACDPTSLPVDMRRILGRPPIPRLLRTVDELQLTDEQLRELVEDMRKKWAKK